MTVSVLTQHNDNSRTGANLQENQLTTSNVNSQRFARLFTRQVDGFIYAQPLYVNNLTLPGKGTHNVVYVATMNNTVYAFDADDPNASQALWSVNLGEAIPLPDPNIGGGEGYEDIFVQVGIVSTPVISLELQTLYVVAATKLGNAASYNHSLHALDLTTGKEKFGGPAVIQGTVPGTGSDNINGQVTFTSHQQLQRSALLLAGGRISIAFASYGDHDPYHGWIFAYDAATLEQKGIFNATPNSGEGGIWQAGQGPSADDANNVYCLTGNNYYPNLDSHARGNSFLQLTADLQLANWYSPSDQWWVPDQDIGSGGALLIPGTNLLIGGGKSSILYLLNRPAMTPVQSFAVNPPDPLAPIPGHTHHIHGSPVYWNGPNGPWIYLWAENDWLKAYAFNGSTFNTTPVSHCTTTAPDNVPGGSIGMPGGMLSISSNGNTPGTGIVWASHPYSQDALHSITVTGILRAYDASDLTKELWNDIVGNFAKFCPPTIANGKVYMATFSGYLAVYGLLPKLKDGKDNKDDKDNYDGKASKDNKDGKDSKEHLKESKERKESKDGLEKTRDANLSASPAIQQQGQKLDEEAISSASGEAFIAIHQRPPVGEQALAEERTE